MRRKKIAAERSKQPDQRTRLLGCHLPLVTCVPMMTSDRGLVGGGGRRWDLSFLDSDSPPSTSQPTIWSVGQKSRDGFWTPASNSQSDVISSEGRRHVIIPHPTTGNAGGLETSEGASGGRTTNSGGRDDAALPSRHFYQNVGIPGDDVTGTSAEVVDRITKVTIEDNVRFLLPVANASRAIGPAPPLSSVPWLTVTPSGSDADTGSRSQSFGSQDSLDLDCLGLRIRDDSGIGVTGNDSATALPRRNSSAPVLNDLSGGVVVCRPSPSPLGRRTPPSVDGHRRPGDDLPRPSADRLPSDANCSGAYMKIAR